MAALHLCGFSIPLADGESTTGQTSGPIRALDGSPSGGIFDDVEDASFTTIRLSLSEARAIANLCRGANGHKWSCDNSVYSSSGLAMTDTPTFQTGTIKFGTHAISVAGAAGDVTIATVETSTLTKWTVAAWTKDGGGAWAHHILRSDGAKWVDGVRNDSASLLIDVPTTAFQLLDHATNTRYFDDLVWLPFEIHDDWGAEWPLTETFANLPQLKVWGDLFPGYEFTARATCRIQHSGQAHIAGTTGHSARVVIGLTGGTRSARA